MRSSTIPPVSFVSSVYCAVAVRELVDVVREHRLEEGLRRPVDVDLAHVRDVEGAGVSPHRLVLGNDTSYWTGISAGERHHARAELDMARVQGRTQERRFHGPRL